MSPELDVDVRAGVGAFALDLRLRIERGPVALVGPNGAGKTSLLRLLAGGLPVREGRIAVRGRTLVDTARGLATPPEGRRVGYLPQGSGLFMHLSALENAAYGVRGASRSARRAHAQGLLAALGVGHLAHRRPRGLSGGEQQRVALARALGPGPELLLLDEPTAALDVSVRRQTRELLRAHLHDPARCAVVVTHDLRDLLAWQPTVVLLDGGRVVEQGDVAALRARTRHPFLAELLSAAE